MIVGFLHRYRIAIAASIGIAVALAIAIGILLSLGADPMKLRLVDQLDPERTVVYISMADREALFRAIDRFAPLMEGDVPTETDILNADHYELAILRTETGPLTWIARGRHDEMPAAKSKITSVSETMTLLLPITERRRSLGNTALFRRTLHPDDSFVWFTTSSIPLPVSDSADIVRAAMSPFAEGMVLFDAPGRGKLLLRGKSTPPTHAMMRSLTGESSAPDVLVSVGNPLRSLSHVRNGLAVLNPSLLSGLLGILQSWMEEGTGSTDLAAIGNDLLAGPITIDIRGGEERTRFGIAGTAARATSLDLWLERMSSTVTQGRVRHMEFFKGEYVKSDVVAQQARQDSAMETYHDWTMQRLGGSGSDLSLIVARSGRRYVISNDEAETRTLIDRNRGIQDESLGSGTIDVGWATEMMEETLPFLRPILPTTEAILGQSASRLTWRIAPIPGGIGIEWARTQADLGAQ